jgi:histidinol-phosphate aminotransferase
MKLSRRGFIGALGVGTAAGVLSGSTLLSRPAYAQTRAAAMSKVYDGGIMQLNQNESARGPGPRVLEAIREHATKRVGRGYSPDHVNELRSTLADYYGVTNDNVLLATGSTPLLEGAVHAFCSSDKPLVTAVPTYSTSAQTARRLGFPIKEVQVDTGMSIDLAGMAAASVGAGLVYFCNPNNPTGTVHSPAEVERFVRQVLAQSPETRILIDEAYINYVADGLMETALPLAKEFPNVFITRSFSKAHGLAGMRIGYALGQEATLDAIGSGWGMGDVNMLAAVAALTAFDDHEHIAWERDENARVRSFTTGVFTELGYEVPPSQTNHLFVNLRMPAARFREACLAQKVSVGRDFPPMHNSHCRISLGSMEEMEIAAQVFRRVLTG